MHRSIFFTALLPLVLLFSGCLFDHAPSGPSCGIDTWLIGQWQTSDKSGHTYQAVMSRATSDHYHLLLSRTGNESLEFDGWISRVDGFPILVFQSLNAGTGYAKFAFFHYELLSPSKPPPGGVGATRIRLTELNLDESSRSLDSYQLRKVIRSELKSGTLIPAYDVVAEKKQENEERTSYAVDSQFLQSFLSSGQLHTRERHLSAPVDIPGSIIWTRTGGVTLKGETF